MENQPLVSIIVAVYNAASTLRRCFDSLLSQTYKTFEIIVIDDGSSDGSSVICDEYSLSDERFRVIHQENRGVSFTRQRGIDIASGKYVIHADPDDWVESETLQAMVKYAEDHDTDMLICDFWHNCGEKEILVTQKPTALNAYSVIMDFFPRLHGACWNKLVKRSVISKYRVRFNDAIHFCEDLLYNITLLTHPINVSYLNVAHYHYVYDDRGNSLASQYNQIVAKHDLLLFQEMIEVIPDELHNQTLPQFAVMLMRRAYKGHIHSSKEFKDQLRPLFDYVKQCKSISLDEKILLILSCKGYYSLAYYVSHTWFKCFYKGAFKILKSLMKIPLAAKKRIITALRQKSRGMTD